MTGSAHTETEHTAPRKEEDYRTEGQSASRRAWFWIFLSIAVLAAIGHVHFPDMTAPDGSLIHMSAMGATVLAILIAAVILWVSEALPFAVTALLVFLMLPALGVLTGTDPKSSPLEEAIRNGLGRPMIPFFIGVLILSTAFVKAGLGERAVDAVLERVGRNPDRLMLAMLAISAFLGAWVTALAAVATLFPLAMSLLQRAGAQPMKNNLGRSLMLAVCMGSLIGGMAAPTGAAPNMIVMDSLLREKIMVRFTDWMAIGCPAVILMIPLTWLALRWFYPIEKGALDCVSLSNEARCPLSSREWAVIAIFLGAIFLWIFGPFFGEKSNYSFWQSPQWVGLMAGLLCFLPGLNILTWKDAERDVPWGALLVMAAGLSLGYAFSDSGAAKYTACILFGKIGSMPCALRFFGVVIVVSILHLVLSSNTVTGAVVVPLMIAMAGQLRVSPWLLCAPAAFTCPLALILPTESPNGLIAYSSGYFTVKDMAKVGILLTLCAVLVIGVVLNLVVPHQTALLQMAR